MHDSEHLVSLFNTEFSSTKVRFMLAKLGRMLQYLWEDLNAYVEELPWESSRLMWLNCWKCFSWRLPLMNDHDSWIYLKNLSFSFFFLWLIEVAMQTSESVTKTLKFSSSDQCRRKGLKSQLWRRIWELKAPVRKCLIIEEKLDNSLSFNIFPAEWRKPQLRATD